MMFISCSDPNYNEDYEQGYEKGYSVGYHEGYDEGYADGVEEMLEEVHLIPYDYLNVDEMVQNYLFDNGIYTITRVLEDIDSDDASKIMDILDEYYNPGIYGEYIGDASTKLIHYSKSECFYQIHREDMIFFMLSIEDILELGYWECPICFQN